MIEMKMEIEMKSEIEKKKEKRGMKKDTIKRGTKIKGSFVFSQSIN